VEQRLKAVFEADQAARKTEPIDAEALTWLPRLLAG
jgi:hypothetical protein